MDAPAIFAFLGEPVSLARSETEEIYHLTHTHSLMYTCLAPRKQLARDLASLSGLGPPCGSAPELWSFSKRHICNTGHIGTGITVNRWVGI